AGTRHDRRWGATTPPDRWVRRDHSQSWLSSVFAADSGSLENSGSHRRIDAPISIGKRMGVRGIFLCHVGGCYLTFCHGATFYGSHSFPGPADRNGGFVVFQTRKQKITESVTTRQVFNQ